jgi:CRP-like cAMP-binding protein
MTWACYQQLFYHLSPAWLAMHSQVKVLPKGVPLPKGDRIIVLQDDTIKDSLGYHTELAGDVVSGVVGVGVILKAGKKVLTGDLSVSTVLSHEVCEMLINPSVSGWSDSGRGWLVATEVCDPVQSSYYDIGGVSVSNFVTPDFFSPVVSPGDRFDYMGVLKAPFQIAKGGYVLNYEGGKINTYYGAVPPPEWLMKMKDRDAARTRRLKDHRPQ